jgi:succinate dehydrogenase/fumarate reductase-like Fe-S protein
MKINRLTKLACKTRAITESSKHDEVLVESMGNIPLVRDLVVDMDEFWKESTGALRGWWLMRRCFQTCREKILPRQ